MDFFGTIHSASESEETPAPGTSEAKQWEEDWDDAGWDDEDQDAQQLFTWFSGVNFPESTTCVWEVPMSARATGQLGFFVATSCGSVSC